MATTTTNYGFDVPTSSDLVKNGATQIALLGQDIDTFLFRPLTNNYCVNSDTSVWQRGTSIAAAGSVVYGADRWAFYRLGLSTGATVSRQASGLTGFQYSMRIARDSGNANTEQLVALQAFESATSIPLAGKTITYSFYAKAGANFSATSSTMSASIISGTGTDQSPNQARSGSWTSQATALNVSPVITTSWARYSGTVTLGSTVTQIALNLGFAPTGTAGANDWVEVTGIQLEIGSQVSPFQTASGGSPQAELAMCQRYYWRAGGDSVYQPYGVGAAQTGTVAQFSVQNPVPMRVAPTSIDFSTLAVTDTIVAYSLSALSFANSGKYASSINATTSSLTVNRTYILVSNNSTSGYFGLSAEL